MEDVFGFIATLIVQLLLAALFVGSFFMLKQLIVFLFLRRPERTSATQLRR